MKKSIIEAKMVADYINNHPNPVYFKSLEWDGVERMPTILNRVFGVSGDTEEAAEAFFGGCVERAFEPGKRLPKFLAIVGDGEMLTDFLEITSDELSIQLAAQLFEGSKHGIEKLKVDMGITHGRFGKTTCPTMENTVAFISKDVLDMACDSRRMKAIDPSCFDKDVYKSEIKQVFAEAVYKYSKKFNEDEFDTETWLNVIKSIGGISSNKSGSNFLYIEKSIGFDTNYKEAYVLSKKFFEQEKRKLLISVLKDASDIYDLSDEEFNNKVFELSSKKNMSVLTHALSINRIDHQCFFKNVQIDDSLVSDGYEYLFAYKTKDIEYVNFYEQYLFPFLWGSSQACFNISKLFVKGVKFYSDVTNMISNERVERVDGCSIVGFKRKL